MYLIPWRAQFPELFCKSSSYFSVNYYWQNIKMWRAAVILDTLGRCPTAAGVGENGDLKVSRATSQVFLQSDALPPASTARPQLFQWKRKGGLIKQLVFSCRTSCTKGKQPLCFLLCLDTSVLYHPSLTHPSIVFKYWGGLLLPLLLLSAHAPLPGTAKAIKQRRWHLPARVQLLKCMVAAPRKHIQPSLSP